jgi:hypothetical protein
MGPYKYEEFRLACVWKLRVSTAFRAGAQRQSITTGVSRWVNAAELW